MWQTAYTLDTDLAPAAIWGALRALQTGAVPLRSGDRRELTGPFAVHGTIAVTPVGLGTLQSTITELVANQVLAEQTNFNDLVLLLRHTLRPLSGGGTRITRQLEISGDNADREGPIVGPRISEDYPAALDELVASARTRD
jgi:hypothetical protein